MQIQLYTTSACHLCELAEVLLQAVCEEFDWTLAKIEIADSDRLLARYGVRIPVVTVEGGTGDLGWPFDAKQLREFLLRQSWRQAK